MKKIVVAACTSLSAMGAMAEGSVTVFGIVDQFAQYGKSGAVDTKIMQDGGNLASRIGFRGNEDLGGGLRAKFVLEAGITANTGSGNVPGPGLEFTRQSYVSLGNEWGAVEAGRMYMPLFYGVAHADPVDSNALFSPLQLRGFTDAQPGLVAVAARANNLLRYRTTSATPYIVDIGYSFGDGSTTESRDNQIVGGRFGWEHHGIYAAYSFQSTNTAETATVPGHRTIYQALSGSYEFGSAFKLYGNAIQNRSTLAGVPHATILNVNFKWKVSETSEFLGGVSKRSVSGSPRGQLGGTLGYDYDLSKRTALYARFGFIRNRGNSAQGYAGIAAAEAGDGVQTLGIGMSQRF